jgi:hypothetical protein
VLLAGRVVEQGTHQELAARENGLYARFLQMQEIGGKKATDFEIVGVDPQSDGEDN